MVKELRETHRRRHDGLQEGPPGGRGRHGQGRSSCCARRVSPPPPRRPAAWPPKARWARTSTPAARSACWWRSTARPTSWPVPTSSRSWCATSPCTSPPPIPASCRRDEVTEDVLEAERQIFREQALEPGQAGERRRPDRRGQGEEVLRRDRAPRAALRQGPGQDRQELLAEKSPRSARTSRSAASPASSWARGSRRGRTISPPRSRPRSGRRAEAPRLPPAYRRILLKLSGEALMGARASGSTRRWWPRSPRSSARSTPWAWSSRSWSAAATSSGAWRRATGASTGSPATTWACWRR